jgi:hypothetical protein
MKQQEASVLAGHLAMYAHFGRDFQRLQVSNYFISVSEVFGY